MKGWRPRLGRASQKMDAVISQECQTAVLANVDTNNKNGKGVRSGALEICMRWMEWKGNLSVYNQWEWCSSCPFPTQLNKHIGPGPS